MKYINAKNKKLHKIRGFIQLEIKSGRCNKEFIGELIEFLKITLSPWEEHGLSIEEQTH